MELYLGPVLALALGLLSMVNPWGLGDAVCKHLNKYPLIDYSVEAARRQNFVRGRAFSAIGGGALVWVLLLDIEASHTVKVAFMAVAAPSAFALAVFTIIDTNRRAMKARQR